METLRNMKLALIIATIGYCSNSVSMDVVRNIDVNTVLQQAEKLASQIPANLDLNMIQAAIEAKLHNIPNSVLELGTQNIDAIKAAIAQAKLKLPIVIKLLNQDPRLVLLGFEGFVLPKLKNILAQDAAGQSIINAIQSILNLAKSNPTLVAAIATRVASFLNDVNNLDINSINSAKIAGLLEKYEGNLNGILPDIRAYINRNAAEIQKVIAQIKAMNLNFNVQQLIDRAKNEAAGSGLNFSSFGF